MLLIGVATGGVVAASAWSLLTDHKTRWALTAGTTASVVCTFGPSVLDAVWSWWVRRARRDREVAAHLVADLPESVAWLLHPDKEVIGFFGRGRELRRLETWCADPDAAVVRLVTAAGGFGKTRLARRFAAGLDRWEHWRLAVDREADMAAVIESGDVPSRLLVTVDYAESRDPAGLAALLVATARYARTRVRVLLLARSAGPWWTCLSASFPQQAALVDSMTVAHHEIALQAEADERPPHKIFSSAVAQFADHLGCAAPRKARLRHQDSRTPLLRLHAEALVAVLGGPCSSDGRHDVLAEVLSHEARYWRGCARRSRLPLPDSPQQAQIMLRRVVGVAALLGAEDQDEIIDLVRRVPGFTLAEVPVVSAFADWLADLYPGDGSERLGTLQPDLLAEHLAVEVLNACTSEQRRAIFAGLRVTQAVQALTVLGRAAEHHRGVPALIDSALGADPTTMTEAVIRVGPQFPGLYAARLAVVLAGTTIAPATLRVLADRVPYPSVELHPVALALTTRIVDQGRGAKAAYRSTWLAAHSLRLAEAGRPAEALAASHEALKLRRRLAARDRATQLRALAATVGNHGLRLGKSDRPQEALAASREAVELFRQLTARNRTRHMHDLGKALCNYEVQLAEAGQSDEALKVNEETLTLRRVLAAVDRDAHLAELASTLTNRSAWLAAVGRPAEAVDTTQEAVDLYRELAGANPDTHLPALATTLENRAGRLTKVGRCLEALAASGEALALRRALAARHRAAYLPELAASLSGHASVLTEVGRRPEALIISYEAVKLCREAAAGNGDAHLPGLARSLHNHAMLLAAAGHHNDALAASQEAAEVFQGLMAGGRVTYRPEVAAALNNHAARLAEADQPDEALLASQEAVATYRELVVDNRDYYLSGLAASLWTMAGICVEAGVTLTDRALAPSTEAVRLFEELANQDAAGFTGHLRGAARTLAAVHDARTDVDAAAAVRVQYGLSEDIPHRRRPGQ